VLIDVRAEKHRNGEKRQDKYQRPDRHENAEYFCVLMRGKPADLFLHFVAPLARRDGAWLLILLRHRWLAAETDKAEIVI
jgi:hypothetical protein